jgi:histidinol-phosphate/aromatic aminotransferase/cobyric acid decarboxylase-like protein/NADP-dependent 3-hydroxy acid dehydrogenase YdfG
MEKKLIILCLGLTIILLFINLYRRRVEVEHFQTNYLKDFHKYLDGIKTYNLEKREKKDKIEVEKNKKYKSDGKMKNEKILITGATSGIGYNITKFITKYKCPVFITGKNEESLKKLKVELEAFTTPIYYGKYDLTKDKSIDKLYKQVKREMGVPTILFNCAIFTKGAAYISTKPEADWKREIDLNLKAVILLSQKVGYAMYLKGKGRIILFSTYKSKNSRTNYINPDKIVTEHMIENFSNVYSDEMHEHNVGVTCVRVDEELNVGNTRFLGIKVGNSQLQKTVGNAFFTSPKKIMPVIEYVSRAPVKEISGKVISTKNFSENRDLMSIVAPNKLINHTGLYNNVVYTKTIPRDKEGDFTTLTKQNPHEPSQKVKKFLEKGVKNFNKFNTLGKYDSILDNVIAKKLGVDREQIVFFKNEYEATKRLCELFLSKGSEVVSTSPPWAYLELCSLENKAVLDLTTMESSGDKQLTISYDYINIGPKTKILFLGSPNHVSGQTIKNDTSWKTFYKNLPDNVLLVVDQRYEEFVYKTKELDKSKGSSINPLKLLKKNENMIVFRSFNNFYSVENLELCYFVTSKKIANLFKNSQVINPIDKFNENLALTVIDDPYYEKTKKKIQEERQRMMRTLTKSNINYYESETNFFLIETNSKHDVIMAELETEGIILYNSMDGFNDYWTLPVGEKGTNDKVLDILRYDNLDNN